MQPRSLPNASPSGIGASFSVESGAHDSACSPLPPGIAFTVATGTPPWQALRRSGRGVRRELSLRVYAAIQSASKALHSRPQPQLWFANRLTSQGSCRAEGRLAGRRRKKEHILDNPIHKPSKGGVVTAISPLFFYVSDLKGPVSVRCRHPCSIFFDASVEKDGEKGEKTGVGSLASLKGPLREEP